MICNLEMAVRFDHEAPIKTYKYKYITSLYGVRHINIYRSENEENNFSWIICFDCNVYGFL